MATTSKSNEIAIKEIAIKEIASKEGSSLALKSQRAKLREGYHIQGRQQPLCRRSLDLSVS